MWQAMERENSARINHGPYTRNVIEGVKRVKESNGEFAFLSEATTIEYFLTTECDLMQIGALIDLKSYGIAMKQGLIEKYLKLIAL